MDSPRQVPLSALEKWRHSASLLEAKAEWSLPVPSAHTTPAKANDVATLDALGQECMLLFSWDKLQSHTVTLGIGMGEDWE